MDSIYWVVSRDCNQRCGHCYNDSEPGAPGLDADAVDRCVAHLPDPADVAVGRIILSGGEVLVWPELLLHTLGRLRARYGDATQVWMQTNGDLLDAPLLRRLLAAGVRRVDVSSMDAFHPRTTLARRDHLTALFEAHGLVPATEAALAAGRRTYAFWGATPDQWIGPLWPRGRARRNGLSSAGPEHAFCRLWSGAKGFLDYRGTGCEVNIQLADVYPCCPMTCAPLGSLLDEPLIAMLDRCAAHPVFRALNEGRPEAMGETLGISEAEGFARSAALGNHCLWCDEFFTRHAPGLLATGAPTARGTADLTPPASVHSHRAAPGEPAWVASRPLGTRS